MKNSKNAAPRVEVRRSAVHGLGVFALVPMRARTLIGTYEGRRYTAAEVPTRDWDDRITYLFGLSDGSMIDGSMGGNATRHLNHACEPNCQAIEIEDGDGALSLRIETIRSVRAGDELTLDYALQVDPAERDAHPCACGSTSCRGTLIEPGQHAG